MKQPKPYIPTTTRETYVVHQGASGGLATPNPTLWSRALTWLERRVDKLFPSRKRTHYAPQMRRGNPAD